MWHSIGSMYAVEASKPGGPEVLEWREVADPECGPDEVVIAVAAAGINRADLMQREGKYPPPAGASPHLGLECAGQVRACGDNVSRWRVGDEVCALLSGGGYAERAVVDQSLVLPVPAGVSVVASAGLVEVAATVQSNLSDFAQLGPGDWVLIHGGSGGIGTFAIQWARNLGATVFTTARQANHAELKRLGADVTIDYRTENFVEVIADHTNGNGVNAILDNMGAAYLDRNIAALAKDGRLAIIGMQGGRKAELNLGGLLGKRGTIMAAGLRSRDLADRAAIITRLHQQVWPDIAAGRIVPVIASRVPMSQASQGHRQLETGGLIGKVVLTN